MGLLVQHTLSVTVVCVISLLSLLRSSNSQQLSDKHSADETTERLAEREGASRGSSTCASETCESFGLTAFVGSTASLDLKCPSESNLGEDAALSLTILKSLGKNESLRPAPPVASCPTNIETPPWLLDDALTPIDKFFVRNNGDIPRRAMDQDSEGWTLTIDGIGVDGSRNFTLQQLKSFPTVTRKYPLQCAGHGRAGYRPQVGGNQWTLGAVGFAEWTGVLLKDILSYDPPEGFKGLKVLDNAVYLAWEGLDRHCEDTDAFAISRGVPIEKALDGYTMLAWEMNAETLPAAHGFPLRLIAPGYPGSAQGKWLKRLWVRDQVHDGPKMTGTSYRMPLQPLPPGHEGLTEEETSVIEEMPVYSIITSPPPCTQVKSGDSLTVRGKAWSGMGNVVMVEVSVDQGRTWTAAFLSPPVNKYAWQVWTVDIELPGKGYWEIYARATDEKGRVQPLMTPGWNPKGYLNNSVMKINVDVV
ncbi:unnamed protein product [Vitrella brassicaformis CCMP3155]|uniref:Sulfite oxidase n=1 Tax=Vitrella brassicaformis (strain CCMP3155) TaxID=1169540 RepID=A0A0G4F7J8_VITBC|nr:unnamed protein product [Vitrella brassicaformis CCMP3155]|mmetsp:Transcript_23306/g.66823  ORF Transcript_23306/g.66823 Transcript_23306/m.66823 type:complete len:474 (-) Transcript_23306:313-1734(-)|eukprot:CEM08655.1 unnamed protein product [Vitrella brassicaformis CCMP3155]